MSQTVDITDPTIAKAISHPTRLAILKILDEREASPVEISRELDASLGTVSYHVRHLADIGLIELRRTTPRRGAVEHHYAAVTKLALPKGGWDAVPAAVKRSASADALTNISKAIIAASKDGGFDAQGAATVQLDLRLDARGRREAAKKITELQKALATIERESRKRAKGDDDSVTSVVILQFDGKS